MTEIIRAGLQAVDPGQIDAAKALGMTRLQAMRYIVIPQALRIIVPPTFNEYINMSKNTSLLVIMGGVAELLFTAQAFYSANYRVFEALAVAAIWYLLITSFLTQIQSSIEKRFGERQDVAAAARTGFLRRLMLGGGRR
jgi:polar amino acid transport system permease protein